MALDFPSTNTEKNLDSIIIQYSKYKNILLLGRNVVHAVHELLWQAPMKESQNKILI